MVLLKLGQMLLLRQKGMDRLLWQNGNSETENSVTS
jgi:hypothetical protein